VEGPVEADQIRGIFDRICAEWTSYQREKSGLCDLVRIVADVSAGEGDILVIYCMGAPAA